MSDGIDPYLMHLPREGREDLEMLAFLGPILIISSEGKDPGSIQVDIRCGFCNLWKASCLFPSEEFSDDDVTELMKDWLLGEKIRMDCACPGWQDHLKAGSEDGRAVTGDTVPGVQTGLHEGDRGSDA